jgi:large subunit ribosomal protein L18
MTIKSEKNRKLRRLYRTRNKILATSSRPRLAVHRSSKHLYAQVICNVTSNVLAFASTLDKSIYVKNASCCNKTKAKELGDLIGQRAKAAGVTSVVFDRGPYAYHGVVAEIAAAAREHLEF